MSQVFWIPFYKEFTAAENTLTIQSITTDGGDILGNGTETQSHFTLIKLPVKKKISELI